MAAQRPVVMEALKTGLIDHVAAVDGQVVLPWDAQPDAREDGPWLQIAIIDSTVDDTEVIGRSMHAVSVRVGCVQSGPFDYAGVWDVLNEATQYLSADPSLGGACWRVEITGLSDQIEIAGDKIMWPHVAATIFYLTPVGSL